MKKKLKDHSLYLVITEEYGAGRSALEIAQAAIKGGVDIIQMREKAKTAKELLDLGKQLSALCKKNGVTFIVNDDPILAKEVDADGVHLGQEDIKTCPIKKARKIIGEDKIVGVSTHSLEQFEKAGKMDVDYIAFGPVFPTKTKDYSIGTGDVKLVAGAIGKPVFFIGGISNANCGEILQKGAKNIALIRDIIQADDIMKKTAEFKNMIKEAMK